MTIKDSKGNTILDHVVEMKHPDKPWSVYTTNVIEDIEVMKGKGWYRA